MKLFEVISDFNSSFGETPLKTVNDNLVQKKLDDTRKPRITLAQLNKLRKLRELKKFNELKRDSLVSIMYNTPTEV